MIPGAFPNTLPAEQESDRRAPGFRPLARFRLGSQRRGMTLLALDDRRRTREAARAEEIARAERRSRWTLPGYLLAWMLCFAAGTGVTLLSFSARSQEIGDVLFWGGLCIGNVGGLLVLMVWAVRGTAKGDL